MVIGNIFQIENLRTRKSYLGRSLRMLNQIRNIFKKKDWNINDFRIKVLYTSISDNEKQVREELRIQYKRFLKQCDHSLNENIAKEKPLPKKPDKRINKPSPYSRKVLRVDNTGRPRAIFNSVSEASRITGCNKSLICKVCNNQLDYVKGKDSEGNLELYKFQYL